MKYSQFKFIILKPKKIYYYLRFIKDNLYSKNFNILLAESEKTEVSKVVVLFAIVSHTSRLLKFEMKITKLEIMERGVEATLLLPYFVHIWYSTDVTTSTRFFLSFLISLKSLITKFYYIANTFKVSSAELASLNRWYLSLVPFHFLPLFDLLSFPLLFLSLLA